MQVREASISASALTLPADRIPAALATLALGYAAVWAASALAEGKLEPWSVLLSLTLGIGLVWLSLIDLVSLRLPDWLTFPLLLLGLGASAIGSGLGAAGIHAVAAVLGYGLMTAVAEIYRRSKGRDGLGRGDAKLLAATGAWVGIEGLAPVLLAASLGMLAVIGGASLLGRRIGADLHLPFGPAIAASTWVVWHLGAPG